MCLVSFVLKYCDLAKLSAKMKKMPKWKKLFVMFLSKMPLTKVRSYIICHWYENANCSRSCSSIRLLFKFFFFIISWKPQKNVQIHHYSSFLFEPAPSYIHSFVYSRCSFIHSFIHSLIHSWPIVGLLDLFFCSLCNSWYNDYSNCKAFRYCNTKHY